MSGMLIGSHRMPDSQDFILKKGVKESDFKTKVETALSSKTLTKESYKQIKDSMSDGRKTLDDMLQKVGEPKEDIKASFARGKSGKIELTDQQRATLQAMLLSKAHENNSSPVLHSFKAINIDKLGTGNVNSLSKELNLSAGFSVGASAKDLGLIGVDAKAKATASTTGTVNVSAEMAKDGKVKLTFNTLLKGGIDGDAKAGVGGLASFGAKAKGEVGFQVTKSYTFNNKKDAVKFLKDGGVGLQKTLTSQTAPSRAGQVQITQKSEPVLLGEARADYTKIVPKTSNSGTFYSLTGIETSKTLSKQSLSLQAIKSPSRTENTTKLATNKGDKSNTSLTVSYEKQNGAKLPATGSIDVSVNFSKIAKAKDSELQALTDKMTDRLVSVMEKSNTVNKGSINFDKAEVRSNVENSLKMLRDNFSEMTDGHVAASTLAIPLPVIKSSIKVGSVLNLHYDLENNNGKLQMSNKPPLLQVNKENGFSLGATVHVPIAPGTNVKGNVSAYSREQRTFEPTNNQKANKILGRGWKEDPTVLSLANKEKPVNGLVQSAVNHAYDGTLDDSLRSTKGFLNRIGDFFG